MCSDMQVRRRKKQQEMTDVCILYTVQTGSRLHLFIFLHLNPFSLFQLHTGHAFENCAETDMLCDVESAILGDVVSPMLCDVVSAMLCDIVSAILC